MKEYSKEKQFKICGFTEDDKVMLTEYPSRDQIQWGGNDDPCFLELNKPYKVETIDIRSYHTKIKLENIDGWFNSVTFKKA